MILCLKNKYPGVKQNKMISGIIHFYFQEEVTRRRIQRSSDGSVSGSVEELEATPAIRSRAASARSNSMKPEPAPRPSHLSHQPQQLVVYQPPWPQPALLVRSSCILLYSWVMS